MTAQERDQLARIVFCVATLHSESEDRHAFYEVATLLLGFNGVLARLADASALLWEETDARYKPEADIWLQHDFGSCIESFVGLLMDAVLRGNGDLFGPARWQQHCRQVAREAFRTSCFDHGCPICAPDRSASQL